MKSNNFDFTIVVSYRYKRVQVHGHGCMCAHNNIIS